MSCSVSVVMVTILVFLSTETQLEKVTQIFVHQKKERNVVACKDIIVASLLHAGHKCLYVCCEYTPEPAFKCECVFISLWKSPG